MSTHNIRHPQAQISSPGSIDMFDFRNGMLGVVIVALALGGAIFGAYFAGIESVEHEVVKYNELADVTGLFDTDKSPQYIDFDPSTNYVGYYSEESYSEEMGKYYFAEDQVGYIPNQKEDGTPIVNNYKIIPEPVTDPPATIDLRTLDPSEVDADYWVLRWVYNTNGDYVSWAPVYTSSSDVNHGMPLVTLKDLILSMNIPSNWTNIRIVLDDVNWDEQPTGQSRKSMNMNAILFLPISSFKVIPPSQQHIAYMTSPNMDISEIHNVSETIIKPYQSVDVNLKTWTVKASYTTNPDDGFSSMTAEGLVVCSGNSYMTAGDVADYVNLSYDMDYRLIQNFNDIYLNPNKGVYLKGGE